MANLLAIEKKHAVNDKGSMPEADEIDATLKSIAKMLVEARAPLIYGLTQLTVEAQELAVELAMCLRGAIDTPRGSRIPPRGTSLQLHGEARTTLGELRQYADLLVCVDCEPTPEQRASFAVEGSAACPAKQLLHMKLAPGDSGSLEIMVRELCCRDQDEVLALRKKLKHKPTRDASQEQVLAAWQTAKYPVLVYQPANLAQTWGKYAASSLLEELERAALARAKFGRAAAWPLEEADAELSNAAGAEYVLTARTGYPAAVHFFNGTAEFLPGVTDAQTLLADGVIDAALFLGDRPCADWSAAAQKRLQTIPTAIIAAQECLAKQSWKYQIGCGDLSEERGTILREDGVPRPLTSHAPAAIAEKYLRQLLDMVRDQAMPGAAR